MISKLIFVGAKVFHELYGIGTFKGWWMDKPEYARVEYLLDNKLGNLLIPRKDLTEIEDGVINEKQ